MTLPDFICIGAQKAGTTWLHENLSLQPEIWLPPVKELHFLDHPAPSLWRRLASGASHHRLARKNVGRTLNTLIRNKNELPNLSLAWHIAYARRDWNWYQKLFSYGEKRLCGEICPGYARLSRDQIAELALRHPKLKIIYLLRDPIDRAWSSVAMHFRKFKGGLVSNHKDDEIIQRLMQPKTFAHCTYRANIENWLCYFPQDRVYFGFFDGIRDEPMPFLADILHFLEIPGPMVSSVAAKRVNRGKGERITPLIERQLASLLLSEAEYLDQRFANSFTSRWLHHAREAQAKSVTFTPKKYTPPSDKLAQI